MSAEELKPCPFCGGAPLTYRIVSCLYVCCSDVTCIGNSVNKATAEKWNTRAESVLLQDALVALVSARDTLRKKMGTNNRHRDKVIADLSAAIGVEVVPAAEKIPVGQTP